MGWIVQSDKDLIKVFALVSHVLPRPNVSMQTSPVVQQNVILNSSLEDALFSS